MRLTKAYAHAQTWTWSREPGRKIEFCVISHCREATRAPKSHSKNELCVQKSSKSGITRCYKKVQRRQKRSSSLKKTHDSIFLPLFRDHDAFFVRTRHQARKTGTITTQKRPQRIRKGECGHNETQKAPLHKRDARNIAVKTARTPANETYASAGSSQSLSI